MTGPTVIGVDPGARHVGIVAKRGRDLLGWAHLDRHDLPAFVDLELDGWLTTIVDELEQLLDAILTPPTGPFPHPSRLVDLVAVEETVAPSPHAGMIDPTPLMATAQAGGAAFAWGAARGISTRFVHPSRHGTVPDGLSGRTARKALEELYPAELIGPRETTGRGKSPLQHARAAWDVARAGEIHLRTRSSI